MSAPPPDTLARLIRAADNALRRLLRALSARLRRFLLRRKRGPLSAQLVTLSAITGGALRLLIGASPIRLFPHDGSPPRSPLARLLRAVVRAAVALVRPDEASKAAGWQEARTWVDPRGRDLSARLWRNAQALRVRIDREVGAGLRAGTEPQELARRVEVLLLGEAGQGDGRGALRRLIDTESTRAHGLAVIEQARQGGRAVRWVIRSTHALTDQCGRNARADAFGMGKGVYPVDSVPLFPDHPHCLCRLVAA